MTGASHPDLTVEYDRLKSKNDELALILRDTKRRHLQTKELYHKLKQKAMLGQMQEAGSDAVASSIEAAAAAGSNLGDHLARPGLYGHEGRSPQYSNAAIPGKERGGGHSAGFAFGRPSYTAAVQARASAGAGWNHPMAAPRESQGRVHTCESRPSSCS